MKNCASVWLFTKSAINFVVFCPHYLHLQNLMSPGKFSEKYPPCVRETVYTRAYYQFVRHTRIEKTRSEAHSSEPMTGVPSNVQK